MNIIFGLKLWSINTDLIDQAIKLIDEKKFDYIELFVIPGTQINPFMIDVPYIIHIPHHKFGVNIGDASKKEYNMQKIDESITWANKLDAKYLILHAGDGSMEHAADLLSEITDNRFLIENMPKMGLDGETMIGYSPEQIEELIGDMNMGLCLDFGHAVKAAVSLGVDYKDYMKEFLKFEPKVFHISDGMLNIEKDEHLNIGEGEYDFEYFISCVRESRMITLETTRNNHKSLYEDVKNMDGLKLIQYNYLNKKRQKLKIVSTIEARMTSTRLPGKILKPILGRPVLELLIERLQLVALIDEIVVATTTNSTDDPIVNLCNRLDIKYFRGSEEDVLIRVLNAAKSAAADIIVEITGDCPLIDPAIIEECLKSFLDGNFDYVSNTIERSYPDGLDVQVFPVSVLEEVNSLTKDSIDHEHVSLYIYKHPERYKLNNLKATGDLFWPELGITLDTQEDYELISIIFEELYPKDPHFSASDIVKLLHDKPELLEINRHIKRKEIPK